MRLIGLTGPARSGKSTVADILVEQHGFDGFSFAGELKSGARYLLAWLGPSVEQHLADDARKEVPIDGLGRSPRELWQTLGTEWGRNMVHPELWVMILAKRIEHHQRFNYAPDVVISDVRFRNEAEWIREHGGEVWRIVRPGFESQVRAHESEAGVPPDLIDRGIVNDGDLDSLVARVGELLG